MSTPEFTATTPSPPQALPLTQPGPAQEAGQALSVAQFGGLMPQAQVKGKTRSPFGVWVLTLVTFGIYGIVWYYKVNRELRDYHPSIQVNPGLAVLALFFPIAGWCTIYNTGKRVAQAQQLAGMGNGGCSGALGVLLCFVFGLQPLYYQSELNRVWRG
jgi:hypothetical protein